MNTVLEIDATGLPSTRADWQGQEGKTGRPDFLEDRRMHAPVDWGKRGYVAYSLDEGVLRPAALDSCGLDSDAIARRRSLLSRAGGALSSVEVGQRLGVPQSHVEGLRRSQRLLAVADPDGEGWLYPACQFDDGVVLQGFQDTLAEFRVASEWTRLYVLVSEDPALSGRSPIQALRDGDLGAVRRVVRGYGEQGGA